MIRAHTEVSLILTELQKSCFQLKSRTYQFLDNICQGIGSITYESMTRKNYFIQNPQNLRIFILPMDAPIVSTFKPDVEISTQHRYLFLNLIDWVNLSRTQKRIYVLLELMNFKDNESEVDRFSAAASIYYGMQSAGADMTIQQNGDPHAGHEIFYFQQNDKLFFSSTRDNENKTTVYIGNKDMIGFQLQSCSAYRDYPAQTWVGFDYRLSSAQDCRITNRAENQPMMLYPKQSLGSTFNPMTFSEQLKILLRCGN